MSTASASEVTADQTRRFVDSPAQFFGQSWYAMQHLPSEQLAELQLAALRLRLAELRDRIPVLSAMVSHQRIEQIDRPEDVVPLLLQHSVYKSYPISLLENNRFGPLTRWLDRLTTCDLSGVSVEHCESIDSWLDALEAETEVRVAHSSATSGTMSFLPRSVSEFDRMYEAFRCGLFQFSDPRGEGDHTGEYFDLVWPLYRHGRSMVTRTPELAMKHIIGSEDRLHCLRPGRMSSDTLFLAGRLRAAAARGGVDQLELTPALRARREQFEREQREMQESLPRFFGETIESLKGKRIWLLGTWNTLYEMASAGLERGMSNVFAPDSLVSTGGGAKGQVVPDGWEDVVRRFTGVAGLQHAYGMSELMAMNKMCGRERYHFEPWIVPFALDPEDGHVLPRRGEHTGRGAFFDLSADTSWGGFISGDEITLNCEPCDCGRTTAHIARSVERYSDKQGGDDKISCAASDEAHASALEVLNDWLV